MPERSRTLLAFAALLVFGCAWGATQPLTKVAVSTGYQPFGLIFWQFFYAVVLLGAVIAAKRIAVPIDRRHLVFYTGIALIGTVLPNSFGYLAAARLPAGIMAVVITTVPMFSLIIALLLGNERFRLSRSLGIVLGVSAMLLIALPEASLPAAGLAIWVFVALIAPFCYGIEGNYVAMQAPRRLNPLAALWGASVIGLVFITPLTVVSGQWIDLFKPWQAPEWAMLGTAIAHLVAYTGYIWLVGFAGVVFTAQISYVVTLAGITNSIVFLGESYSPWVWLAVALMLVGLSLVQPAGKLPDAGEAA
ncbi:DMT family transporter [Salaquimonas pukyongi]|uniref:DMT family transporter n=1 Tax=Salaquimonas pukyongi TaxID=2712698 RepID=UPI00096BBD8B|nr:DMT family transporter [Salaquimonas pukyongi]